MQSFPSNVVHSCIMWTKIFFMSKTSTTDITNIRFNASMFIKVSFQITNTSKPSSTELADVFESSLMHAPYMAIVAGSGTKLLVTQGAGDLSSSVMLAAHVTGELALRRECECTIRAPPDIRVRWTCR